jgi:hypothetical protein
MNNMVRQIVTGSAFRFFLSAAAMLLILGSGCSGLNPAAIPLELSQLRNYGSDVKAGLASVEAVTYGRLMPGGVMNDGAGNMLLVRYEYIHHDVAKIIALSKSYNFDDAAVVAWANTFENKVKADIAALLIPASHGAHAAKSLAGALEPYIKSGGSLEGLLADGKSLMPNAAHASCQVLSDSIVINFQVLYQSAIALALGIMQHDASAHISAIETAESELELYLQEPDLFANGAHKGLAEGALTDVSNKRFATAAYVAKMSGSEVVAGTFTTAVAELMASIAQVKAQYIDNVTNKPEVVALYDAADKAAKALDGLGVDYQGIESLKSPQDPQLMALVSKLNDVAVSYGALSVNENTDLNDLMRMLSKNNVLVLVKDTSSSSLIEALAAAVVFKVAPQFGLKDIANVIGPEHNRIKSIKKDRNMSDGEYNVFLASRARLIREKSNKNGVYKNIFVVFADDYDGGDVSSMIQEFSKDGGKVVVVTAHSSKYSKGAAFFKHDHLNIPEGIIIADALIKEYAPTVKSSYLSQNLVKDCAGFGKLTLGLLPDLVRAALAHIHKSSVDVAISNALEQQGISQRDIIRSEIKRDTPSVVQVKLSKNRSYYLDKARGR